MLGMEINRCATCDNRCDEAYQRAANFELMRSLDLGGDNEQPDEVVARRRQITASFLLGEVVNCGLSEEEINTNIDHLVDITPNE